MPFINKYFLKPSPQAFLKFQVKKRKKALEQTWSKTKCSTWPHRATNTQKGSSHRI